MTPQLIQDCSTIFSIMPHEIKAFKPGIYPGWFCLDACKDENKPERLLISKPSLHAMHVAGKREPIMIPTTTYTLAKAVVDDYFATQMFLTPDARPGLTWIQGNVSLDEFLTRHMDEHKRIKDQQKRWFFNMVKQTDIFWVQSKKSPKVVSDSARYAAKFLGLDKEWAHDDIVATEFATCPACFAKCDPRLAICNVCFKGIINKKTYDELQKSGLMVA